MMKRSQSVNFVALEGFVTNVENVMVGESFAVKATIRLERRSKNLYVDVYGFGNTAQSMVLTCDKGNKVYIEGKLMNAVAKKNRYAVALTPYIGVTFVECLLRQASNSKRLDKMIAVLDGIDPIRYLRRERRRNGRGKLKDDLHQHSDDEG